MTKKVQSVVKTVDELCPFDDTFMQILAEDIGFCEELLQVVMDNPKLNVVSNLPQKHLHSIDTRSVTVDMLCEDEYGRQFSVEVQKEDNDDHLRRVRYNGACVQVRTSVKGSRFRDLPDVYMIYITEKDFLKGGKIMYHVDRVLSETGEVADNGYYEIYVNGEIDDATTLAEYVKLLKSKNAEYNEKFPRTSKAVRYYKLGEGRKEMCKVVEEYAKEYAKDRVIKMAESLIKRGVADDIIQETTELSLEEIVSLKERI